MIHRSIYDLTTKERISRPMIENTEVDIIKNESGYLRYQQKHIQKWQK